ncbi:MAG TPA: hypothetical protein VKE40_17550 [Gemmataceae bacterium]|nr:hypothetical protein [Gemmataceae bacterium]
MRGILVRFAGTVALVAVPATAPAADPFEAQVRNLAHPRYVEREKAARELERAGEPALKVLKAAMGSADEEVRARAAVVVAKIERAVRSERLLAAPKIALKFDKTPLNQAVDEVARKTGLRLTLDGSKVADVKRPVTLDTGEVPIWEAVQAFYAAAGLAETEAPPPAPPTDKDMAFRAGRQLVIKSYVRSTEQLGPAMIRLGDGKPDLPADLGRALRVRALPAGFAQNKYDDVKGEVTFHLDVDAIPSLNVQEIIGVDVRRATAEDARALAPAYPAPEGFAGLGDHLYWVAQQVVIINGDVVSGGIGGVDRTFPVTLKSGGLRPKRLAELDGVVVAKVVTPPEVLLTVPDVFGKGKGQVYQSDGLTCQVLESKGASEQLPVVPRAVRGSGDFASPTRASEPAGLTSITVRVMTTGETGNEVLNIPVQVKGRVRPFLRINRRSGEMGVNLPEFRIQDADGLPLKVMSTQVTGSHFDGTSWTQEVRLTFQKPTGIAVKGQEGVSLSVHGRRVAVVELPFTLKDVSLP